MLRIDVSTHAAPSRGPNDSYEAVERIFREADKRQKLRAPWTPKLATSAVSAVVIGILEEWAFDRSNFPLNPHGKDVICTLLKGFVACADDTT
jgi:TetR/AcrR family acrAB operon transcriptional repressor